MSETGDNTGVSNGNGNGTSSWAMWQRLVLSEIKRLDEAVKKLQEEKQEVMIKMAVLQSKAGIWGAVAGVLAAGVIEFFVYLLLGHMHIPH